MEKSFEIIAHISETALWFATSPQPLCPRDQQAHTQPDTYQLHKWGCQMGLPRELCSGVKQQWGERQVLYMLLKARRDFWHGYLEHLHRYSCAETVGRCLIAFSFGKIFVIWYWYPYTAIFHVYLKRFLQVAFRIYNFVPLFTKSEVSLGLLSTGHSLLQWTPKNQSFFF